MAEGTEINEENYRALQREIVKTQNKLNNLKTENSKWNKTGTYLTNLGNELDTISDKIDKVGNKLTLGLTVPVVAGFTKMTQSAIENETAVQQVDRIYGEAAESIKDFAENKALDYNMSAKEAYKYSQIYGNLIQSITDDQTENAEQTQKLLQASSVIASATGRSMEDVMDRIRSGLLGNTEAIEDLGVNVNVALLETTDAFKQIAGDRSWDKLEFQEQQQIRLLGILEQTSKKYGDEVQENTASSIQQLTAKTKNLTNNLGKKLLPIANKVLDKANDLVDEFGNLSDEEQENIVKIGLMVAAAGPLLKVGSTAVSTVGKVTSGLGTMTKAIGVASGKMTSTETSVNSLAKILQKSFSPAGLAVGAVVAGVGLMAKAYADATEETRKQLEASKEVTNAILEEEQSINELRNTIDANAQTDLNNIERTQDLWKELQKITDENGNIKEGYENRAKVITEDLSEALGTEISITDNVIDKYKELQDEIDTLILKKQGETVLSASEEKYNQAMSDRSQKTQELIDKQEELNEAKAKENELYEEYKKWLDKTNDPTQMAGAGGWYIEHQLSIAKKNLENQQETVRETQKAYDSLDNTVEQYTKDIEDYMYNYELFTEGTSESIQQMIDSVGKSYVKNGETVKTELAEQIKEQQLYNQKAKASYDEAVKNNNESEMKKSQFTIDESKRRLNTLIEELIGMTSITEENSPEVIEAWKQLATNSYSVYYDEVSKLPEELSKKIQEMTGVTIERTPEIVEETRNMAESVLNEFKQNEDFRTIAIDNLEGFLQGLEDEDIRQLLKDAGIENVEEIMKGIKEGNLAEDEGEKILSSLQTGLENKSWRNTLWNTARSIASTLSGLLTVKANVNGKTSNLPGHKSGLDYVPYDDYIARLHKGERVLTAEENKQLMKMEKASKLRIPNMKLIGQSVEDSIKTVFTTPNITFNVQKMDEANLNTAFNYINRRLGSQY